METWAVFFLLFFTSFPLSLELWVWELSLYICVCVCRWTCRCRFSTSSRLPYARCSTLWQLSWKKIVAVYISFSRSQYVLCIRTRGFLVCLYFSELFIVFNVVIRRMILSQASPLQWAAHSALCVQMCFFSSLLSLFIESVVSSDIAYQNQPKIYVRIYVSSLHTKHVIVVFMRLLLLLLFFSSSFCVQLNMI